VRDVAPLLPDAGAALWRISVAPAAGGALASSLGGAFLLDWGGGLVWLATREPDAGAGAVREAVAAAGGGHATLLRAPDAVRAAVPVFEPEPAALAALSARVREAFDPRRILNPGRMAAGG
jgi:glycolate oxidase FAD binding subunit